MRLFPPNDRCIPYLPTYLIECSDNLRVLPHLRFPAIHLSTIHFDQNPARFLLHDYSFLWLQMFIVGG